MLTTLRPRLTPNSTAPGAVILGVFAEIAVGASFGVMLRRKGGALTEIATFRSEGEYGDGRRPDAVRFEETPETDSRRRDFTINALYEDPVTGEVLEHTKGPKIRIHKFKNKTGYHKRQGHRQQLTVLKVTGIK